MSEHMAPPNEMCSDPECGECIAWEAYHEATSKHFEVTKQAYAIPISTQAMRDIQPNPADDELYASDQTLSQRHS